MEIQDIIQGLSQAEINAITAPEERTLIVNTTLNQAVVYVNGTFKQASFANTDDIPEGVKKFATTSDLSQIANNATEITNLQNNKEDSFNKNTAFNKDFGTSSGTVLEGNTPTITPTQASDIAANTSKRHDPITVTDTTNINLTLVNQDIQAELTNTGVTAGTYNTADVTVDSKGRITNINTGSGGGNANLSDLAISQGYLVQNVITAATLTANVDNWNPTGFNANTDMIRVNVNANQRSISGIIAPSAGVNRILAVKNINTASLDLRFVHNSSSSLPANRFLCRDNNSKSIKPNETALWFYDHIVSRWSPFNRIG